MGAITDPPFKTVGIVGLGLIGGSVALGVRRRWPDIAVLGVDYDHVSAIARGLGVITEQRRGIDDLWDADLILLATPIPSITALVAAASQAGLRATVTDVGSTKRHIVAAAKDLAGFVGGHPVAGSAQGGIANARPDLFDRREWLVVPGAADARSIDRVEHLAKGLGALPRRLDAETHDRLMAYVSHVPQLLSTALMMTAGQAIGRAGLAAAGPGFADMTRLASSSAEIWRGIFATNADFIAEAVGALVARLPATPAGLQDADRIEALFRAANEWAGRT